MTAAQDPNEAFGTPPTLSSPQAAYARQTVWPILFGSIGLILTGWNIFAILTGVAKTVAGPAAASQAAATQAAVPESIRTINLAIQMALTIWLLWGSLDLVRRRATASKSLRGWATTKLVWLGINIAMAMEGLFSALGQAGPPQGWTPAGFAAVVFIGFLWGLLPVLILPVFTLIWFNRRKIKGEVAGWV